MEKSSEKKRSQKRVNLKEIMRERLNLFQDWLYIGKPELNCTPFVRQYDILSNKWGVLLCQKEYQTNDIRRSSREWL